jgi:hypothetical protein
MEPADRPAASPPSPSSPGPSGAVPPEVVESSTRAERRPRDMVLSLLVLLVPIALFLAFYRGVLGGDGPVPIDPSAAVDSARRANAFPVAVASGLPEGWTSISATFNDAYGGKALRIGYDAPGGGGVQLVETNAPVEAVVPGELGGNAAAQGAVDVNGRSWQRYTARPGERALVLLKPQRTTIVLGSGSEDELKTLAASLGTG